MIDIYNIIGFDPHNLPDTEENKKHEVFFQVRALYKIMLYVHSQLNYPRMFDPDLGQYVKQYSAHTKQEEDYLPISYNPLKYTNTKIANCGVYSNFFELLVELAGFETRHIGLRDPDGRCGHWCSEVKVNKKWVFFDPTFLICSVQNRIFYSAVEIMQDPIIRYFNLIPPILQGMSEETTLKLWSGLEINKQTSYDLGLEKFIQLFYGEEKDGK